MGILKTKVMYSNIKKLHVKFIKNGYVKDKYKIMLQRSYNVNIRQADYVL